MTYLQFHMVFTLPVLAVLALVQGRPMGGVGRAVALKWLGVVTALAVAYTTPWDNYLIYRGVWTYPPSAVLATIGYVPVEEYAFFVIQTLIAGLAYLLLRRMRRVEDSSYRPAWFRPVLVSVFAAITVFGVWLLVRPDLHGLYLGLILAWAGPALAGMSAVGAHKIWAERRAIAVALTGVTLYLWAIDRYAIARGIWSIERPYRLGVDPLGLPIEEAVFFVVTTLLCLFGLALFLPSSSTT